MATIKAVTPTSAGLAQVFDTSDFVREDKEDKAKREQRLNMERLNYDPKGLFDKDIPAYQQIMSEYQDFVATNNSELLNSSENMEVWRKKVAMENEIKNFIAGSSQFNQQYYTSLQKSLDDPKYRNDYNREYMTEAGTGTTLDSFRKGESWENPMTALNRNTDFKLIDLATDVFKTIAETSQGVDVEAMKKGLAEKRNFYEVTQEVGYDEGKLDALLESMYMEKGSEQARDIRYVYEKEGGLEKFKEDMLPALIDRSSTDMKSYSLGTDKETGGKVAGYYDAVPEVGSTTPLYEFAQEVGVDAEGKVAMKDLDQSNVKKQRGLATVNKTVDKETGKEIAQTGGGTVLKMDGMNITITGALVGGENLTTGKPLTPDEAQIYKDSQVLEVGNYWQAIDNVVIDLKGEHSITIESGTFMPDLKAMLDNGEITDGEYNRIMKYGSGRLINAVEGAVLASKPDEVALMQRAEGMDYTKEKMLSEGGQIYTIVPLSTVKASINSAINAKRVKLAEATNGDPLSAWMEENNMSLDDTYMSFFTGGTAQQQETGLRD